MELISEDTLKYIPFVVCIAVVAVAGIVYGVVQYFKKK